jgi:hypothetical protein
MLAKPNKMRRLCAPLIQNMMIFLEMPLFDIYPLDTNSTLTNIRRQFISDCDIDPAGFQVFPETSTNING